MATVTLWKNVAVALQSAAAATKTISAITKANPGVATSSSHGYSNGDFVLLVVSGMSQVNNKVVRVSSVATDTFALEGVDTSAFDTFSSGTASKLTFGTSLSTVTGSSSSGGDFTFEDTSTIHDGQKTQVPSVANPTTYTFDHFWDPSDAGQSAMKTASDAQTALAVKFTFGTGGKIVVFYGYVGFPGTPGGSAFGKVTTQSVITQFGRPTYYSS
jgi:hypothetical protein